MASNSRSLTASPAMLWSPPEKPYVSITELAATSTKTKISRLLRPRIILAMLTATFIIIGYLFLLPVVAGRYSKSSYSIVLPAQDSPYSNRNHLVIVAGHAIWKGGPMLGEVDEEWTLEPYQKGHNESLTWIAHIRTGVELASDPNSILMFSGYVCYICQPLVKLLSLSYCIVVKQDLPPGQGQRRNLIGYELHPNIYT